MGDNILLFFLSLSQSVIHYDHLYTLNRILNTESKWVWQNESACWSIQGSMLTYRSLLICSALNVISSSTLHRNSNIFVCATKLKSVLRLKLSVPPISSPNPHTPPEYWPILWRDWCWVHKIHLKELKKKSLLFLFELFWLNIGSQVRCKIAFFALVGQKDVWGVFSRTWWWTYFDFDLCLF